MKVIEYFCCALILTCLFNVANLAKIDSKDQQELLDALTTDESLKIKRPFCNAFTGCGRKRSFYENSEGAVPRDSMAGENIQLPVSIYKALLRAATSQTIRNTINRDSTDFELPQIPEVYLSRKVQLRKRFDVS